MAVRDEVVKEVNEAMQALNKAYQIAVTAVPLAADVPVIQEIKSTALKCNDMMRTVSKLRI